MNILNQIKTEPSTSIREISSQNIAFEEKGSIRPGKWDIVSGSDPIFRKLIQVSPC
jgi:hypothetical protein